MDTKPTVFPHDKDARLAELGLTESSLRRAIGEGLMAFASCTENDPLNYPGFSF